MQIRYHGPARPGAIVAKATVIHHGQRTITIQCTVTQNDTLIASVTATFAKLATTELAKLEQAKRGERSDLKP
jgi:acyl-coenzyme A thioesterase PaaI-like protein